MTILESSHISTFVWLTYIFLFIKISLIIGTSVVFFFNNGNIFFLLSVYSNAYQSTLKYLKDTEANIQSFLIMTGNFNIRDSNWDSLYLFYLIHSNLLVDIIDAFNISLSHSTNSVPTRYLDNRNNLNSVIDLMFLRPNVLEFDDHTIPPESQYPSDHTLLVVNIHIINEFIQDKRCTIIKGSKKNLNFISELIESVKRIDTSQLTNKELLELAIQEFIRISNLLWQKYSKCIKTTKHLKK